MFGGIFEFFEFILKLPELVREITDLLYLIKDLLIIFIILLALQIISLLIFILTWFNSNLYNYEGKFDIKLLFHKHRHLDEQRRREQDIRLILGILEEEKKVKKPKKVKKETKKDEE